MKERKKEKKACMIPLIETPRTGKSNETEIRLVVARGWGNAVMANGQQVSFRGDENGLKLMMVMLEQLYECIISHQVVYFR